MADNVLGVLFQNIADAIRAKTGGTETMKPNEFPTQIANIPVGGGIESGTFKYKTNTFNCTSTSKMQTIYHNLGCVPDILIVMYGSVPASGTLMNCLAYSSAMLEALGGGWINQAWYVSSYGMIGLTSNVGMDMEQDPSGTYATYGGVRNVTSTSFMIGSNTNRLPSTGSYTWVAIGGITG